MLELVGLLFGMGLVIWLTGWVCKKNGKWPKNYS